VVFCRGTMKSIVSLLFCCRLPWTPRRSNAFMWDLAGHSLELAKLRGAAYGDVRVMHLRQRDLTTKNGEVGTLAQSESIGLGIRVLANGAWGFASTDGLTREGVAGCGAEALAIAKA